MKASRMIIPISISLLYITFMYIVRKIFLLREISTSVSINLVFALCKVSRCVPNSPTTSVPICSVSIATAVDLAMLSDVLKYANKLHDYLSCSKLAEDLEQLNLFLILQFCIFFTYLSKIFRPSITVRFGSGK